MFNGFPTTMTMSPERQARWANFPRFGAARPAPAYGTPEYVPSGGMRSPALVQPQAVPTQIAPVPGTATDSTGQPMNYATPVGVSQPLVAQVAGGQPVDWQSMLTNMFGSMPQQYRAPQGGGAIQNMQQAVQPQQGRIASFMANPAMQKFLPPNLMSMFAGTNQMPQFHRPTLMSMHPGITAVNKPLGWNTGSSPYMTQLR